MFKGKLGEGAEGDGLDTPGGSTGLSSFSNTSGNTTGLAALSNTTGLAALSNTSGLAGLSNTTGLAALSNTTGLAALSNATGLAGYTTGLAALSNTISNVSGLSALSNRTGAPMNSLESSFKKSYSLTACPLEPATTLSSLNQSANSSPSRARFIAMPSSFALSLCTPYQTLPIKIDLTLDELNEYYEDENYNDMDDYDDFDFDTPSPDDVIINAQKKSKAVNNNNSKAPVQNKPPKVRKSPAKSAGQLTSDLSAMTLKKNEPKTKKASKSKKLDPGKEYEKRLTEKGHVDAGKSTMMGHLLVLLGKVNQRTIHRYQKESEQMKKASFSFAWVLDATDDERSRGVTVDVAINEFETSKFHLTLLDAPGHKDFVPNMISGASQADVAILVVDARLGEFEKGLDHGGQTREHTILLRSLGISQLIVAVNKMDMVDWDEERFTGICTSLKKFLLQTGFKTDNVVFVPTSGFTGDNLTTRQKWASTSLMEAIDAFELPARDVTGNFRLAVQDVFKDLGHVKVSGRIESGSIQVGDSVLVLPIKETSLVKHIQNGDLISEIAFAGDRIDLELDIDLEKIQPGSIICHEAVPMATIVDAQIITFGAALAIGQPIVFHHLGSMEPAKITAIYDKTRVIKKNTTAKVQIAIERPVALETFETCKQFARFTLRYMSESVAAGIVQLIKQ